MKIGIVIEPYEEENTSGIGYVILKQVNGLLRLDKENKYILYTSRPIKSERLLGKASNRLVPSSFLGKFIWFFFVSYFRRKYFVDIFIFHMPLLPLFVSRSVFAIPVHHERPQYKEIKGIPLKNNLVILLQKIFERKALQRAYQVITPSNATRQNIINDLGIQAEKIKVIYNGFQDFNKVQNSRGEVKYKDHFLFVGRVKYKKNVHNILEGFILFRRKNPNVANKLVITGLFGGSYYDQLHSRIIAEGLDNEVIFTGFVSDTELYNLYKYSAALVFCSLSEGFGIPIIEAMNLGTPVITSNRPPMDEVAGGAAFIVNPERPSEIMRAMSDVVFDRTKRAMYVKRGYERAKDFSWDRHMQALSLLIKSIPS